MIDLNKKQKDSDSSSVTNKEGNTLVNQQNNDISVQHQEFPKKSSYKGLFVHMCGWFLESSTIQSP